MRVPESLRDLEWELPHSVHGAGRGGERFRERAVVILPVPYEATTSFGGGTGGGPAAIIEASRYIELYDQELDAEPYEVGIATLPSLSLTGAGRRRRWRSCARRTTACWMRGRASS
jgi:arginase family enzyme